MSFHRAIAPALLAVCSSVGCCYSFDNPVEQPYDGVILGQCQLAAPTAGQTVAGGSISLLFSALQIPLPASGKFLFVDLPNGTYTLTCDIPAPAQSDFPLIAERSDVELPATVAARDGSDSLDIGPVSISATGIVSGTLSGALGPAVVAAFFPETGADGGLGGYEGLSAPVQAGAFQIALPPGNHVLAAADPTQAALAPVVVQAGTTQTEDLTLVPASAGTQASLDGLLVLDGPGLGAAADPGTLATLLPFVDYAVTDDAGTVLAGGPFLADGGPVDGHFHFPVPAGASTVSLTFTVSGTSFAAPADHLSTFTLPNLPVIAGLSTQLLPQVTWLDDGDLAANASDQGDGGSPVLESDGGWSVVAGPFPVPAVGFGAAELFPTSAGRLVAAVGGALSPNANPAVYGDGDLYFTLQTSAGLGNLQYLTDAGGFFQSSLSGAELNGDVLLAWGSNYGFETSYTTALGLALILADGSVFWPEPAAGLNPQISYFGETTTAFAGQLGATTGLFAVVPDLTGGIFDAVFVDSADGSDEGTAPVLQVVIDGGYTGAINLVGVSCTLPEFSGGPGFCLAASEFGSDAQLHGLLLGVATADGGATLVSSADLGDLGTDSLAGPASSAGIGLAQDPSGQLLATFDAQALGGDNPYATTLLVAGPFTTLAHSPAVSLLPVPSTVTALLPDPAGFLAFGAVNAAASSGVGALLFSLDGGVGVDGGAAPPLVLPTLAAAASESPEFIWAYRDPTSGLPTLPAQVTAESLSIVQLGGVP